ncbi:uncharacterized protein LOC121737385 [Aricia agestis]|uniref:uncharacterized protein LOC121737385 n=1 Tax=Aricia agestis TaxID=91739 RepID=UPI001C203FEA|nr:uncharacterized protein LOC121737385 [Aricia agestis]
MTLTIKSEKTTYLIDVAVPNTNNLKQKHTEKIQKYIPLADEIKQMWHQNTVKIIPIVISSTGVIPKTLAAALKSLDLHKNTYIQLQKSIVIDTCSIVRRFLNSSSSFPSTHPGVVLDKLELIMWERSLTTLSNGQIGHVKLNYASILISIQLHVF